MEILNLIMIACVAGFFVWGLFKFIKSKPDSLSAASFMAGIGLSLPLIVTYADTGLVPRLPTAVLAASLALLGLLFLASGLILDSVSKARIEAKRIAYLQQPSL